MLSEQYFLLGAAQIDTSATLSLEFLPPASVPVDNLTDFSNFFWNVLEDANLEHKISKESVIIPYEICEACLQEGL